MNASPADRFNNELRALGDEQQVHESFAAGRRYGYDPRSDLLDRLDEHVATVRKGSDGAGPGEAALVILGAPGAGKSALVAYWADRYRQRNRGAFIVEHYVGAGAGESNHYSVVRHIMLAIKERYGVTEHLPGMPGEMDHALAAWLWYVSEPMVIILDGLNRLHEDSRSLHWLPATFPPNVRVIATTSFESMRDELVLRGWQSMQVAPLGLEERQKIVQRFIAERPTELTAEQLHGVAADAGSANPLLLRMRLEEAHVARRRADLKETIEQYLGASDLDELFDQILLNLEADLGYTLVRDITTLLLGARSGLSRAELAEITRIPEPLMTRMMARLEFYLLARGELLTFYNDNLRDAIARRYLSQMKDGMALHARLADYFENALVPSRWLAADIPTDASNPPRRYLSRLAGELAYQLSCAGDWKRLMEALAPIPIMASLYNGELRYELLSYWRRLGSWYDIEEIYGESMKRYRGVHHSQEELAHALDTLGAVLRSMGRWGLAEEIYREALDLAEQAGRLHMIATANGSLGKIEAEKGNLRSAMRLFRRELAIARELDDQREMAVAQGCMGNIHVMRGEYAKALTCYTTKLSIAERLSDRRQVAQALGSIGIVYSEQGDYPNAMEYYRRQLAIGEELGEKMEISQAVGNMGNVYRMLGDYVNALECHKRKLAIAEELGNKRQIGIAMGNVGIVHYALGDYESALACQKAKLAIAEELGDKGQIGMALGNMGIVYYMQGDYANALGCYEQKLAIATEMGNRRQIVTVLGDIGIVQCDRGEYQRALASHMRKLEIARELGDRTQVAIALGHIGIVYKEQGNHGEALAYLNQAIDGHTSVGNMYDLATCLYSKAALLTRMVTRRVEGASTDASDVEERFREARQLAEKCIAVSSEISKLDSLFEANILLARIEFEVGNQEPALERLSDMLQRAGDEWKRAALTYELATMSYKMGAIRKAHTYAHNALTLCSDLYMRIPSTEYREWIDTLRGILGT